MPENKPINIQIRKTNLSLDLTPEERRKAFALAAANGITLRDQVAQFIREGIDRHMPAGKLVIR